jgi:lysophospholipase L1-like esterase
LARLTLLFASLLGVVSGAEIVARLTWQEPIRRPRRAEPLDLPRIKGLAALAQPNANGVHVGAYYRTNSRAIRGPEYAAVPEPGVFRIVVTGDSVTMGWAVDEQAAYPARLEVRLNVDPIPGARDTSGGAIDRFEVLNFGLAGLNAASAIRRLVEKSKVYDSQMAVYGFTVNDIEGPHYRKGDDAEVNQALADRYRAHRFSSSFLLRVIWPNWIALHERIRPTPGSMRVVQHENYFENPGAWADLDRALVELRAFGVENDVCTVVFLHTHLTQLGPFHLYHAIYDKVAAAAEGHGIPVVRSYDAFDGGTASAYWVSYWDSHPNAAGHGVLAGALDAGLRTLPRSCWQGGDRGSVPSE